MTDVRLFHTPDGGDIEIENGVVALSDGLETAVYLSLFGGNERDSGLAGDDPLQWWGNLGETDPARRYRSETQHLLLSLPAIPASLRRIEDAMRRDLAWMVPDVARAVSVSATMPARNTVALEVSLEVDGQTFTFRFAEPWSST